MPRPKKDGTPAGPPRPYPNPTALQRAMQGYFDDCRDNGNIPPDVAGMRLFLKLSHASYDAYREDPKCAWVFEWAQDMRESWYARAMLTDPKLTSACMNALKQPENGGWTDRRADNADKTLRLKLDGIGGAEAGM